MSGVTELTIKIDSDLKEKAELIFNKSGLNVASAFQKFIEKCVSDGKIPLDTTDINELDNALLETTMMRVSKGELVTIDLTELLAISDEAVKNPNFKFPSFDELIEKNRKHI